MKNLVKLINLFVVIAIALVEAGDCQTQNAQKSPGQSSAESVELAIPNFSRVNDRISAAGQPSQQAFEQLKKMGYKTIINLRTAEEGADKEKEIVEKLGLRYINIPITPQTITQEKVKQLAEVINDESSGRILIHCASSNRVGGMWFLHRVMNESCSIEQAIEEAEKAGLKNPSLKQTVMEFAEKNKN